MRVAFISSGKEPIPVIAGGSIDTYSYKLSKELAEIGIEVDLYTNSRSKKFNEKFELKKFPFPNTKIEAFNHGFFNSLVLLSLLKNRKKYQIIHVNTGTSALFLTRFFNNVVFTSHSAYWWRSEKTHWKQIYAVKKSLACIAISRFIENKMKKWNKNVFYVPNGVDTSIFKPGRKKSLSLTLLSVGSITKQKGLLYLAKSMKEIIKENKEIKWIHIGSGNEESNEYYVKILKFIKKNCLDKNCIFLGRIPLNKLIWYYQNSTLFILPSLWEGLPLVVLEAMSCGLPVIASDIEGVRDVVKKEFLFPPTDVNKMKELILSLLYDMRKLRKVGRENRKIVEMNFSWKVIAKKIKQVYELLSKCYVNPANFS